MSVIKIQPKLAQLFGHGGWINHSAAFSSSWSLLGQWVSGSGVGSLGAAQCADPAFSTLCSPGAGWCFLLETLPAGNQVFMWGGGGIARHLEDKWMNTSSFWFPSWRMQTKESWNGNMWVSDVSRCFLQLRGLLLCSIVCLCAHSAPADLHSWRAVDQPSYAPPLLSPSKRSALTCSQLSLSTLWGKRRR